MTDNTQAELDDRQHIKFNILVPLLTAITIKRQKEKGNRIKGTETAYYDFAVDLITAHTKKRMLDARISTLKKLKNTRPNAELDDQTSDYLRGYREMESKIGFELNRLNKLKED